MQKRPRLTDMPSPNQTTKPDQKFTAQGQGPFGRPEGTEAAGDELGHAPGGDHPKPPEKKREGKRPQLFLGQQVQLPVPHLRPDVAPVPGCPPGLEYLCALNQVLVHQMIGVLELLVPHEQRNKYVVKNTMDQFIFLAVEECDLTDRACFCKRRPFDMRLLDYRKVPVLRFIRPLRCDSACCFCCLQELEVQAPKGTVIGSVRMDFSLIFPSFSILDSAENVVLKIKGPLCTLSFCCEDVVFEIFTADGATKLGHVIKVYAGFFQECCTDADNYSLVFPFDLDVKMKAVLLGALILIDYMYFEKEPRRRRHHHGAYGGGGGGADACAANEA